MVKEYPDVGVWGGPNVTPLDSSPFEFDIGFILSSYFVTGPVSKRYRSVADNMVGSELNLSLCNLIVRSYILKTEKFNNHVITAEENELLYRLRKQNIQMRYSNFLAVGHYRRPSSKYFLNQIKYASRSKDISK